MNLLVALFVFAMSSVLFAQTPPPDTVGPGVSQELARWRAARYSDVRYKLNLTLEKMSPVLKGTIEIRVKVSEPPASAGGQKDGESTPPIILDWRRIKGHEAKSTVSNVFVNGKAVSVSTNWPPANAGGSDRNVRPTEGADFNEHLIFRDGVVAGENVIKLDFTSPILTSGSAITRYVDKEDGSEYIYSLFVPSDASTAFPVFDQPDLKARFRLDLEYPYDWLVVTNSVDRKPICEPPCFDKKTIDLLPVKRTWKGFEETKPISTYVFAFAAGPFEGFEDTGGNASVNERASGTQQKTGAVGTLPNGRVSARTYVRKSQAAKFKPHAAEVFRLNREAVKYFEQYFDYKFPFPKYDLVLIPEFPFGGMEHAGATFLRESSIIFPQEPTKNDLVSRATLIFHEAAHQWFGDTVTMRWFDDLWLKEGFATFTAYKALEKIMPEMNAWKVFYERIKQGAYQTDATKGTTAIYQPIANLSAAKSAYGNIVYNKAPAFLRQAEFYLGEDKFQTAVRAFLKKHEFGNAGWEDLVKEFEVASGKELDSWASTWVKTAGLPKVYAEIKNKKAEYSYSVAQEKSPAGKPVWTIGTKFIVRAAMDDNIYQYDERLTLPGLINGAYVFAATCDHCSTTKALFAFANYQDYGYGIFLLDEKSRDYVLKNIQNEKDPFLRSMMWGALWDSVREGELDPRVFVELVVKVLGAAAAKKENHPVAPLNAGATPLLRKEGSREGEDESTIAALLGRAGTALNYYIESVPPAVAGGARVPGEKSPPTTVGGTDKTADLRSRVEDLVIERMRRAPNIGQRITFYRAFLNIAASEKSRGVLKGMLSQSVPPPSGGGEKVGAGSTNRPPANAGGTDLPLKTKDKFDIVTRLLILRDPDAPKLLADLEKTETSDDAKRWAYAAKAGIPTAENKAKYWNDFVNNKEISESWIEAAFGPWNSIRHSDLTLPYLERALKELPSHKRNRKIFFVNGWLGAFIGGQRSAEALAVVNKFLADNLGLDNDLRLKVLENVDLIERAVRIRWKFGK